MSPLIHKNVSDVRGIPGKEFSIYANTGLFFIVESTILQSS